MKKTILKKSIAGAATFAMFMAFVPTSHAWFFKTNVKVNQTKKSSQRAGGHAYSDAFNKSTSKSFNRKGSHSIGGNMRNSIISGKGFEMKGGNAKAGNIAVGTSDDRGVTFAGDIGDSNNFGHSINTGNSLNLGDNIMIDKRHDYQEDNKIDNRKGSAIYRPRYRSVRFR